MDFDGHRSIVRVGVQGRSAKCLKSDFALFAVDCPRKRGLAEEGLSSTEAEEHAGSLGGDLRGGKSAVDDDEIRDV